MEFFSILCLILLVLSSGFLSCSEIAFFSLPKSKVRLWRHSPFIEKKLISSLLSRSKDLLVLIFFLNTLVNSLVQNVSSSLFSGSGGGFWFKIILPFLLILLLGDYIPKYIGLLQSEWIALHSAKLFSALKTFLQKPLKKMTSIAENLSSAFFFFLKPEPLIHSSDLEEIMATSEAIGLLTATEASLIAKVIDLKSAHVADELVPLNELPKVQTTELNPNHLIQLFKDSRYHLICLVQGSSEELLGIIDASVLQNKPTLIEKAKEQLTFVPETMPIDRLFHHMGLVHATYAAVYDEHGRVIGVFSEKLLRDKLLKSLPSRTTSANLAEKPNIFSGTSTLNDINDHFNIHLKSPHDQKTISGWLEEQLDCIPDPGTSFIYGGLIFRVLESKPTHIETVLIQPHSQKGSPI